MGKLKRNITENIGILLPLIVITILGLPLGLRFTEDERKFGLFILITVWVVYSPILLSIGFVLNYAIFFFIERHKKKPLKFIFIFLTGMIIPILINLLFWINIKLFSFP